MGLEWMFAGILRESNICSDKLSKQFNSICGIFCAGNQKPNVIRKRDKGKTQCVLREINMMTINFLIQVIQ